MKIVDILVLGTRVVAGLEALMKYGLPQQIRGIRYKQKVFKLTIERDE